MSKEYIKDELTGREYVLLASGDSFSFECKLCGNCCRNVKNSIPLDSLDIFNMAKHLNKPVEAVISEYTGVELLTANFPMLFMKTAGDGDACIFLKSNRCTINQGKPRTCRLYPLSVEPHDEHGSLAYMWVAKQHHRYTEGNVFVSDWMNKALNNEDRDFLRLEYGFAKLLGQTLPRLPQTPEDTVLKIMLAHRYFLYDTTESFLPQYEENMNLLIKAITRLAKQ